ncbi:MAG TPA: heavy metal-binding domain-containing protein [Steroidobacteraceae bacterium]|nr:heavy metal-binding domain-containing protein [Steroidobacteraceae bacterium]
MHPQIRRSEPGACPICGMALEALQPTPQGGPSPELGDMTGRFWMGTALALPLLLLEMGAHAPALELHRYISPLASI